VGMKVEGEEGEGLSRWKRKRKRVRVSKWRVAGGDFANVWTICVEVEDSSLGICENW